MFSPTAAPNPLRLQALFRQEQRRIHNTPTGASRPANLVATILYGAEREAGGTLLR
ncbi:hypothetical protein Arad_7252 [Rhizobium rhizogenes K84]|uniref:Uncharacterized protein n=1 Tax=Rhizobium rhizogenes (strain K84 / ATCC BAA-868) TaxID=311403 RepID=B9JML3_RHIR8|nr:hypothetical protein Arad_7252 [Rhizobium rhizogenes K84]